MGERRKPVQQDPPSNRLNDPATEECEKALQTQQTVVSFASPTPGDFSQELKIVCADLASAAASYCGVEFLRPAEAS